MEILRAENISKIYYDEEPVTALRNVSFSIEKGQFVAVIGPSGSGKSTLLHILGGVDRPTSGKVYIDGQNIFEKSDDELAVFRRRQIGIVYQFFNMVSVLNAEENIMLPVLMDGRNVNEEKKEKLMRELGLQDLAYRYPNQLSGGQQQRVAIGRALINDPAIVLADEPTGSLDSKNSHQVMEMLKEASRRYRQTLIVITHDENIALQADRIITMEDGRIIRDEVLRK